MGTATDGLATASPGDAVVRDELVARFLPLARTIAARYRRPSESPEDLMQVASLGLLKAINRFDPARGVPFASYAAPTIDGELKRYLRDTTWAAHVPQRMRERALEVTRATECLRRTLGRSPTTDEVARELDVTVSEVLDAAQAATAYDAVSLDCPQAASPGDAPAWGDRLGAEERRYDLIEVEVTLGPAMRALPARQRTILRLRFVDDMTQSE